MPITSSYSDVTIVAIVVLAAALVIWLRISRNRTATLVLQKFDIAVEPESLPRATVKIVGRMQGVVAFVLSLMGFSPITRFTIAGPELRCESTSLSGQKSQFIPLRKVSGLAAGIHKPISAVVWAFFLVGLGAYVSAESGSWAPLSVALVIFGILIARYFLSKKFFIEVYSHGGPAISLLFKPNVIEGVPIDFDQAMKVVAVIRDMVLQEGAPSDLTTASTPTPAASPPPVPPASQPSNQDNIPSDIAEQRAKALMNKAKESVQLGEREVAIAVLQDIINKYPNTHSAEQARLSLRKIGISTQA